MKLAISATGKDLTASVDPRFGRASYFVIVDSESGDIVDVIDNLAAQDAAQGAGINAATLVANSGAKAVLTGQVGPKAFEVLRASGISIISNMKGKVGEAVEQYRKGAISSTTEGPGPSVGGFGMGGGGRGRGIAGGGRGMGGGGRGRGIAGGGRGMGGGGGGGMGGGGFGIGRVKGGDNES